MTPVRVRGFLIEITSDTFRRHDSSGYFCLRRNDRRFRKQLHLKIVREIHLLQQSLLLDRRFHKSRILNRRPDLCRNGGHQLLVTGTVWLS